MTALLIFGIVSLFCVIGLCVFIALRLSDTVLRALDVLEQSRVGYQEHLDRTLDRLMTIRWEDFVTVREIEDQEEEGGFFSPEEQRGTVGVERPGPFGTLQSIRAHDEELDHEERLLREDFT
jgi:hypothetical protein